MAEIETPPVPRILVWNKTDKLDGVDPPVYRGSDVYTAEVHVSALEKVGLENLRAVIETALTTTVRRVNLLIDYQRGEIISALHEMGFVEKQEHTPEGVMLTVRMSPALLEQYKEFEV